MTPIKQPVWRGSRALIEQPGSPKWNVSVNGIQIERRFEGPYEAAQSEVDSERIAVGKSMPDLGVKSPYYLIREFDFWPAEGGSGILVVKLSFSRDPQTVTLGGPAGPASYEDDWAVIEKAIETHPRYADLTDDVVQAVRTAIENNTSYSGDGTSTELYRKLLRGQESYTVYAPVVRSTTPFDGPPPVGTAGQLEDPPSSAPEGFEWLKTAYRRVKPGSQSAWDLVEEWTGADKWDEDIYGDQN